MRIYRGFGCSFSLSMPLNGCNLNSIGKNLMNYILSSRIRSSQYNKYCTDLFGSRDAQFVKMNRISIIFFFCFISPVYLDLTFSKCCRFIKKKKTTTTISVN